MPQEITIRGGIASVVDVNTVYEVPLEKLLEQLVVTEPLLSTRLPSNTVMYAHHNNMVDYLIERPPSLQFFPGIYGEKPLPLPWLYFHFTLNTTANGQPRGTNASSLYMRPSKLQGLSDNLWAATVPNVYSNADICWGDTVTTTDNPISGIDQRVNEFFATDFNGDVEIRFPAHIYDYHAWAAAPLEGIEYWEHWNVTPATCTANDLLNYADRNLSAPEVLPLDPPTTFTIGRAREWVSQLNNQQVDMLNTALKTRLETPTAGVTPA